MKHNIRYILLLVWLLAAVPPLASSGVSKITKTSQVPKRIFPVLLVEFADTRFTINNPQSNFTKMLNRQGYNINGATGSVADYFNENFKGHATFEFVVSDVITLPAPISEYGAHSPWSNDADIPALVRDACIAAIDSNFNFSRFCTDSEASIENVSIIYAGYSEAHGGSEESIWPHQMNLEDAPLQVGDFFIKSYTCTAELWGSQGDTIAPPGPFCHEFSHFLGLPDMYDTNGETEGKSPALYGSLSIMDNGHFLNGGNTPPYFTAIEREMLGLGDIADLVPDSTYFIDAVQHSQQIYRIKCNTEGEYFLLEFRNGNKWDKHIGGTGLVVYHIDKSGNTYAGLTSAQRWKYNNINSFSEHECARVLPAAGRGCNISGVFFPGTSGTDQLLSYNGSTLLADWNGNAVGIGLKNIRHDANTLSFRTVRDYSYNGALPQAVDCIIYPYQNDARIEWKEIEPKNTNVGKELSWLVSWEDEDQKLKKSLITDSSLCYLGGLAPGTEYTVEIRSITESESGNISTHKFSTHPHTSIFPYIYVDKGIYKTGNKADLRIFNLPEDAVYTQWYINGHKLQENSFELQESGEMEIKAVIGYKDGSHESITKILFVK